jgi:hypothetical protein
MRKTTIELQPTDVGETPYNPWLSRQWRALYREPAGLRRCRATDRSPLG